MTREIGILPNGSGAVCESLSVGLGWHFPLRRVSLRGHRQENNLVMTSTKPACSHPDVTLYEGDSQVETGTAPRATVGFRHLATPPRDACAVYDI